MHNNHQIIINEWRECVKMENKTYQTKSVYSFWQHSILPNNDEPNERAHAWLLSVGTDDRRSVCVECALSLLLLVYLFLLGDVRSQNTSLPSFQRNVLLSETMPDSWTATNRYISVVLFHFKNLNICKWS